MYQKENPLILTTVSANVADLDAVVSELYAKLGLRVFLRFDLDLPEGMTPVALLKVGEQMLEILGKTEGERPKNGTIQCVTLEAPINERIELEPSLGMKIRCFPGEHPGIRSLEILSTRPKEDAALLVDYAGATKEDPEHPLDLEGKKIAFVQSDTPLSEETPGLFFPGWHRFGLQVGSLEESYDVMAASGSSFIPLVKPFQVMSGLKEAMLLFPSGLILQLIEESVVKMTPSLTLEWIRSKFRGHAMKFKADSPM